MVVSSWPAVVVLLILVVGVILVVLEVWSRRFPCAFASEVRRAFRAFSMPAQQSTDAVLKPSTTDIIF